MSIIFVFSENVGKIWAFGKAFSTLIHWKSSMTKYTIGPVERVTNDEARSSMRPRLCRLYYRITLGIKVNMAYSQGIRR